MKDKMRDPPKDKVKAKRNILIRTGREQDFRDGHVPTLQRHVQRRPTPEWYRRLAFFTAIVGGSDSTLRTCMWYRMLSRRGVWVCIDVLTLPAKRLNNS